jgi:hypothetical protein
MALAIVLLTDDVLVLIVIPLVHDDAVGAVLIVLVGASS